MELESRTEGNVTVVRLLSKRLDASVAKRFSDRLKKLIGAGAESLVLDMEAVEFVDSSGLGAIISAFKAIEDERCVAISGPRKTVLSLFKLTRLDKVFQIFEEVEEAIQSVESHASSVP